MVQRQATTSLVGASDRLVMARVCNTTELVTKLQEAKIRHTMELVIMSGDIVNNHGLV